MCSPLSLVLRHKQHFNFNCSSSSIKFWRLINGGSGWFGGGGHHEFQPKLNLKYYNSYSTISCGGRPGVGSQLVNGLQKSVIFGGGAREQLTGIRGFKTCAVNQYAQIDEEALAKGDKVLKVKLKATRLDAVLKAGLNLSRNKIEKAFYDDRVRVNGQRPSKKSQVVYEGDEIDIVRGYNKLNPDQFIDVSRVEIEEIKDPEDPEGSSDTDSDSDDDSSASGGNKIPARLRRSKLLTVRNYQMPWKECSLD